MGIAAGTRLGRYEIVAPIGAGGMGEVYRARDVELDRTVAVKVLPPHVATQGEARARFEREARAISALNHPHICTLHDVGREGETAFFVMELVDGETLASRLAKGRIPLESTLVIAAQMASALAAAHQRGIVHRDLKPANVMLTRSGAKLLDFGIARLGERSTHTSSDATAPPTVAGMMTAEGTILGTLQYMAPEQLEGKPADARADLFSFGCILYELVSGRRAFTGESQASIITAIMSSEPPALNTVVPLTPPALERLVRKCMAKAPDERWQSAADLETELRWIAEDRGVAPIGTQQARRRSGWIWPAIAIAALALLAASTVLSRRRAGVDAQPTHANIANPGTLEAALLTHQLMMSPDGRHLAFVGSHDGKSSVWVRTLSEPEPRMLAEAKDAYTLAWSPDSASLAYSADGKLERIGRDGRQPETICAVSPGAIPHIAWGADGTIVFTEITGRRGLFRVPAAGGTPVLIPGTDPAGMRRSAWPVFVGDSTRLLYSMVGPSGVSTLHTISLDSTQPPRDLGPISSRVQIVDDTMFFVRDGTLFAQAFDQSSLQRTGEPIAIAPHVLFYESLGGTEFTASPRAIAYLSSFLDSRLTWFDRGGNATDVPGVDHVRAIPRISRDGRKAAFVVWDPRSGGSDVWTTDLVRGTVARFTVSPGSEGMPVWSPDGTSLVYGSDVDGPPHLFLQAAGSATSVPITPLRGIQVVTDWTPDGSTIVFDETSAATHRDIMLTPARANGTPRSWLQTPFTEQRARLSPDGKWMAYASNASGRFEIYIAPFDKPADGIQVSTDGGTLAAWRADGSELFYITNDGRLFTVAIRTTPRFDAAPPRLLFRNAEGKMEGFDAAPDGSRFLVIRTFAGPRTQPIELITNWKALLAAKP